MRILANGRAQASEVEQRQLQFLETGMFNITLGNILCANAEVSAYIYEEFFYFKLGYSAVNPKNKLFKPFVRSIVYDNVC